jgi:hypothetical protein
MGRLLLAGLGLLVSCSTAALSQGFPCSFDASRGSLAITGDALDVSLSGNVAYVAANYGGLLISDVSDPDHPALLGEHESPDEPYLSVATVGNFAFVGTGEGSLLVFDVSDPAAPSPINEIMLAGDVDALAADQDRLYVAAKGFWVLDISNPSSPQVLGNRGTAQFRSVRVDGHTAYVTFNSAFVIYDTADPGAIQLVGQVSVGPGAQDAEVTDTTAVVAQTDGVLVLDIANPAQPQIAGSLHLPEAAEGVALDGATAYVTARYAGVRVVDASSQSAPTLVGWYDTSDEARKPLLRDGLLYVADRRGGLMILDPSLGQPSSADGRTETDAILRGVDAVGGLCAVATNRHLQLYDITDVSSPQLVSVSDHYDRSDVCLSGQFAYTSGSPAISVVDISDPLNPVWVGWAETGRYGQRIEVAGNYAFVTGRGLDVFDISDPAAPVLVVYIDLQSTTTGLAIVGDRAFVGDYGGIYLFDITDPTAPVFISKLPLADNALGLAVVGTTVYAAVGEQGLVIADYSDEVNPTMVSVFKPTGWLLAKDPAYRDGLVWIVLNFRGVPIVDVTDPTAPAVVGAYTPSQWRADRIFLDDTRMVLASSEFWLYTVPATSCATCPADWNQDGLVDSRDLLTFLNSWASGDAAADFNGDGVVDTRDVIGFLNAWVTGC